MRLIAVPDEMTTLEACGGRYAASQAAEELEGAHALLSMLAAAIAATPAEKAEARAGDWAASVAFVARSLSRTEDFVRGWLRPEREPTLEDPRGASCGGNPA